MKRRITVFDFDGTLTTHDTLLLFIRFVCGRRAFWWGMLRHAPLLLLMKLHLYNNGKAKERVFAHFFRGMSQEQFNAHCDHFALHFQSILRPEGMATLRQLLSEGQQVYIVSASIDRWVQPFFRGTGYEGTRYENSSITIIGTQIETHDGKLTGRFSTPNCYGEEKVRRLQQLVPNLQDYHLVAYGDSRGDRELMALADEAHYKPFRK